MLGRRMRAGSCVRGNLSADKRADARAHCRERRPAALSRGGEESDVGALAGHSAMRRIACGRRGGSGHWMAMLLVVLVQLLLCLLLLLLLLL